MNMISSLAVLRAGAALIPGDRQCKDAPSIEDLLMRHADKVKEMGEAFEGKQAEFGAQLSDIEQRMARVLSGGGSELFGNGEAASLGQQFTKEKSADLAKMGRSDRVSMAIKATITSSTANAVGSAGSLIVPERQQVLGMPKRRLTIRDLLDVRKTEQGSVERPRQTVRPTGAASVAEGALKPQSDMQFTMDTIPVRTIAHWVKASRQILSDVPQLQTLIDSELRYGLALQEELQLLKGDGTGQNLRGMNTVATVYAAPAGLVAGNPIDQIGLAILQAALTDFAPDGIVVHPVDWWRMRILKDGEGRYIMGDPSKPMPQPQLFGLPVVVTPSQIVDKFTVGAFSEQKLYDREEATVEAGFVNDDFTRNLTTILGEERVAFDPDRPEALVYGDFGFVP